MTSVGAPGLRGLHQAVEHLLLPAGDEDLDGVAFLVLTHLLDDLRPFVEQLQDVVIHGVDASP
jgi:hypothetical protein